MSLPYNAYARLRLSLEQYDRPYRLLIEVVSLFRPMQRQLLANAETDIVIEGFPRSANTFFCSYFNAAQVNPRKVAHHLHSSYQLRAASRFGLPCVFLIREPVDCFASALLRDGRVSADLLLNAYVALYRTAVRLKSGLLVVPHKLAVKDPNGVINAINQKFGCAFEELPPEQIGRVYDRIQKRHLAVWNLNEPDPLRIGLPSSQKDAAKRPFAERVQARYPDFIRECEALFRELQASALHL